MGSMASEAERRMREDGIDPATVINLESGDGPVPMVEVPPPVTPETAAAAAAREAAGSGREGGAPVPPAQPAPSAGTSNTDTVVQDGDPGPIPYPRFKEVNDRYQSLKDFEQLTEYGYTADHLGRLASFEAGWLRDPTGTVKALVADLDLPEEDKARIVESLGGTAPESSGSGADDSEGDQGRTALSPEERELLDWARQKRADEAVSSRNQQLDTVVNSWKAKDTKDELESPPDHRILQFVSAALATGGNFRTYDDIADAARKEWLDERDRILGGAVQGSRRNGTPPPALPDSSALPAPASVPRTLADANKMIKAALERGEELPRITGG